jgi:hypothetical protein
MAHDHDSEVLARCRAPRSRVRGLLGSGHPIPEAQHPTSIWRVSAPVSMRAGSLTAIAASRGSSSRISTAPPPMTRRRSRLSRDFRGARRIGILAHLRSPSAPAVLQGFVRLHSDQRIAGLLPDKSVPPKRATHAPGPTASASRPLATCRARRSSASNGLKPLALMTPRSAPFMAFSCDVRRHSADVADAALPERTSQFGLQDLIGGGQR